MSHSLVSRVMRESHQYVTNTNSYLLTYIKRYFKCNATLIPLNLVIKFLPCNKLGVFPNFTNRAFHLAFVFMQQSLFLQRLFAATSSLLPSIKTGQTHTQIIITQNLLHLEINSK